MGWSAFRRSFNAPNNLMDSSIVLISSSMYCDSLERAWVEFIKTEIVTVLIDQAITGAVQVCIIFARTGLMYNPSEDLHDSTFIQCLPIPSQLLCNLQTQLSTPCSAFDTMLRFLLHDGSHQDG